VKTPPLLITTGARLQDVPQALPIFKTNFVAPAVALEYVPAAFDELCIPMSEIKEKMDSMIAEFLDNGACHGHGELHSPPYGLDIWSR
jgi:hypothetical protein